MNDCVMPNLVKVFFEIKPEWHGSRSETLWAKPVSKTLFKLANSPFFVKGVSFEDTIIAKKSKKKLIFKKVQSSSGHSTYRLLVENKNMPEPFLTYWQKLEKLGCSYEENDQLRLRMFAIDVPPTTNIYVVYKLLEKGRSVGIWDFEEGHCGHILKEGY